MTTTDSTSTTITKPAAHEDWLTRRQTGLGGSDAGAVLGVSPYTSPFELFCAKTGLVQPPPAGEAARWGLLLEAPIRDWYSAETGRQVVPGDELSPSDRDLYPAAELEIVGGRSLLRSTDNPFMLANVDAFFRGAELRGVLEIKTTATDDRWSDGPPPEVYAQLQHYLAVTGLRRGAVAVLIRGHRGGHLDVYRDDEYIERLVEAERAFWERVISGDAPEPDTSESSDRALRALYPQSTGDTIDLPDEADELIAAIEEARQTASIANEIKRSSEARLRALMGAAKLGRTPLGGELKRVDVRAQHVEAHDKAAYYYLRAKTPGTGTAR